ncbi:MAG: choice-of-anchor domain, partial [Conexibacter sp.]|nr:choice-of-anchor domain [Conexibacter sp.]
APDPIGPELTTGQSGPAVPDRLRADVRVVRARVARDGRRLTIVGLASREAVGALSITVSARTTGRRTVTAVTGRRLLGGRFVVRLNLPRAARSWRRLTIAARFAGTDRVAPAVHTLVVVHAR